MATVTVVLMLWWDSRRGFLCIARLHSARGVLYIYTAVLKATNSLVGSAAIWLGGISEPAAQVVDQIDVFSQL